jgi:ADP-ribose pyrophosphatase YjhB (NUDIX family)
MSKERFKVIPSCYLILIQDNKILLSRRFNTGYEDGNYSFVAGHLDGGETIREGMVREAKEESNIDSNVNDLEVVHVMHRVSAFNEDERVDVFLQAKKWSGDIKIMESNKCDEIEWFPLDNLPKNIIPYIRQAIDCIVRGEFYSEFGF